MKANTGYRACFQRLPVSASPQKEAAPLRCAVQRGPFTEAVFSLLGLSVAGYFLRLNRPAMPAKATPIRQSTTAGGVGTQ